MNISKLQDQIGRTIFYFVLLTFVLISVVPIIWIWSSAFKPKMEIFLNPFGIPKKFILDNLLHAWSIGRMNVYFWNSIYVSIPTVLIVLSVASLAGYGFAKLSLWGKDILFFLLLLGLIVPFQGIIVSLYQTIFSLNLIDNRWAVILSESAWQVPFSTFLMRSFFRSLPDEFMDAARIDGCSEFQIFRTIMLPLAKPAILSLVMISFMWIWNDFLLSLLFLHKESLRTLPLGLMFFRGRYSSDYALIAAGVTICSAPIIIVYIFLQRYFEAGIASGGIK